MKFFEILTSSGQCVAEISAKDVEEFTSTPTAFWILLTEGENAILNLPEGMTIREVK
jgi:hypothetical protein